MDRDAQLEELDSLKSIYYSEEFQVLDNSDANSEIQAIFWAYLTLSDNYKVKYFDSLDSPEPSYLTVKHLPPVELRLTLPKDYPTNSPPSFVISCQWLDKTKISCLCKKLDDMWLENGPAEILYSWCDFLKNDSLAFLGCDQELDLTFLCLKHLSFTQKFWHSEKKRKEWRERGGFRSKENKRRTAEASNDSGGSTSVPVENDNGFEGGVNDGKVDVLKEVGDNQKRSNRGHPYCKRTNYTVKNENLGPKKGRSSRFDERAVLSLSLKTSPVKVLENYNTEREQVEFLRNFYTCNICFSDKPGKECTQFRDCKHIFCVNCIRSYFTTRIEDGTVHSITCPETKCTSEALPSQVKEVVSEELFAKYDSVLLTTALDTLSDIIYCPRQICQYPVSWDPEERMASCPNCQYVFCVLCKMVYHGIAPCQYKAGEAQKLVEQYENGSTEVKQQMETRYGKKRLESLVNNTKAETWIKENSKPCPRCNAAIEKSQGCNKMVCWKCNAPFCWLCCEILDPKDPYAHFRDQQSQCVDKLFHLVYNVDEEDEEIDDDWALIEVGAYQFDDNFLMEIAERNVLDNLNLELIGNLY